MTNYLFADFLTNRMIYQACKNYWEVKIRHLLTKYHLPAGIPYLNTTYANGSEFMNGNPMVNLYVEPKNKAVRIIQEEPESDYTVLGAWTEVFETENYRGTELVISLELTPKSEEVAFDLIEKWFGQDYEMHVMEKYINFIHEKLNPAVEDAG